jgi:hypothetical protein
MRSRQRARDPHSVACVSAASADKRIGDGRPPHSSLLRAAAVDDAIVTRDFSINGDALLESAPQAVFHVSVAQIRGAGRDCALQACNASARTLAGGSACGLGVDVRGPFDDPSAVLEVLRAADARGAAVRAVRGGWTLTAYPASEGLALMAEPLHQPHEGAAPVRAPTVGMRRDDEATQIEGLASEVVEANRSLSEAADFAGFGGWEVELPGERLVLDAAARRLLGLGSPPVQPLAAALRPLDPAGRAALRAALARAAASSAKALIASTTPKSSSGDARSACNARRASAKPERALSSAWANNPLAAAGLLSHKVSTAPSCTVTALSEWASVSCNSRAKRLRSRLMVNSSSDAA